MYRKSEQYSFDLNSIRVEKKVEKKVGTEFTALVYFFFETKSATLWCVGLIYKPFVGPYLFHQPIVGNQ